MQLSFVILLTWSLVTRAGLIPHRSSHHVARFDEGVAALVVPNRYSVALKDDYSLDQHWKTIGQDLSKTGKDFVYSQDINVYWVTTQDETFLQTNVRHDAGVEVVEKVNYVETSLEPGIGQAIERPQFEGPQVNQKRSAGSLYNKDALWPSAMLSHGSKHPPFKREKGFDYVVAADPLPGTGVNIYVLDTGIQLHHPDFLGVGADEARVRAVNFQGLKPTDKSPFVNEPMDDVDGHGTHVASIAGNRYDGMGLGATLVNVKVLGKGANSERIAAAINEVTKEHLQNKETKPPGWKGSVINMSLGTGPTVGLRRALQNAFDAGIPIAAAAGNDNINADNACPCMFNHVVCVGAVDVDYGKADYSNWGPAIDAIAPGTNIQAASIEGDLVTRKSGTSMASPFVAGIMSIFLSQEGFDLNGNTTKIYQRLRDNMLEGIVTGFPSSAQGAPNTVNLFATTGINHPNRQASDPYVKGPVQQVAA